MYIKSLRTDIQSQVKALVSLCEMFIWINFWMEGHIFNLTTPVKISRTLLPLVSSKWVGGGRSNYRNDADIDVLNNVLFVLSFTVDSRKICQHSCKLITNHCVGLRWHLPPPRSKNSQISSCSPHPHLPLNRQGSSFWGINPSWIRIFCDQLPLHHLVHTRRPEAAMNSPRTYWQYKAFTKLLTLFHYRSPKYAIIWHCYASLICILFDSYVCTNWYTYIHTGNVLDMNGARPIVVLFIWYRIARRMYVG